MSERDSTFVFIPAELAEDVELPLDVKKDILYLYGHLETWTHWEILGLPWNASAAEVRSAYVEKVRRFHPDRYAGRKIGTYLGRIEKIFRALTVARDELSDETRRAAYARKTAPRPVERVRTEAELARDESRARERRARLARTNPLMSKVARVHELLERGRAAAAEGRWSQAAADFLLVASLDPNQTEARELAEDAKRRAARERAQELYDSAQEAEAVGQHTRSIAILREAAELEPGEARYATMAAKIALASGNTEKARNLAEEAVRAGPRDARAFEVLGMALHAQGQIREARRALAKALEIEPHLPAAKELAKKLRWSFLR